MDLNRKRTFLLWVTALVCIRMLIGGWSAFYMMPVSVDDYFRVFHAWWWWEHPSFTSSFVWLPGYQYMYGPVVGWCGDTVLAPRLFTLGLHLTTGLVVVSTGAASPFRRIVALAMIYFSPLSIPVGSVPFSESLTFFLLAMHWRFMVRFQGSNSVISLFGCSLMLMMASAVRYEVWMLIPVFLLGVRPLSVKDASAAVKWSVLVLPMTFPLIWILHGCANREGCFAFLAGTREDHLGTGSVVDILTSYWGIISLIQIVIIVIAVAMRWRTEKAPVARILSGYLLVALMQVILLIAADALPSQLTGRILYPPLILGTLCWTIHQRHLSARWLPGLSALLIFLGAVAFGLFMLRPPGIQPDNYQTAKWVEAQFQSGMLSSSDYVVVSKHLPDSAAILILGNQMDNIHIDSLRSKCTLEFLTPYAPTCELPRWAENVQVIITWKGSRETAYMKKLAWKKVAVNNNWIIWRRPPEAVFPERNRALHPLLLESVTPPPGLHRSSDRDD